jgi:hypothetical protein
MLPICMVNEEALAQVPEDVRLYLRGLRRRIIELEKPDPRQRIAELETANRRLQVELDGALALALPATNHPTDREVPAGIGGRFLSGPPPATTLIPAAAVAAGPR